MRGKRNDKELAWRRLSDYLERQITLARMIREDISRKEGERRAAILREKLSMLQSGGRIDAKQVNRIRVLIENLVYVLGHLECASQVGQDRPAE